MPPVSWGLPEVAEGWEDPPPPSLRGKVGGSKLAALTFLCQGLFAVRRDQSSLIFLTVSKSNVLRIEQSRHTCVLLVASWDLAPTSRQIDIVACNMHILNPALETASSVSGQTLARLVR